VVQDLFSWVSVVAVVIFVVVGMASSLFVVALSLMIVMVMKVH